MRMRRIERMLEPLGTSLAPNEETAPVHTGMVLGLRHESIDAADLHISLASGNRPGATP